MRMNLLTIGNDSELFVRDRKTKEIISAIPLVPEGKENPRVLGKGFAVLHDNVAIEFNIPYAKTRGQFVANLREGFRRIHEIIGKDFELVPQASYHFKPKFLEHPDARRFGCAPEFDAYEMRMCRPPDANTNLRAAAAHIHIGRTDYQNPSDDILINPFSKNRVILLMDLFVGLTLTLLDKDKTSKERKQLYGRAGRFRIPAYGVEYRTPPNYYLRSPDLTGFVYDLTKHAVSVENDGKSEKVLGMVRAESVQAAINGSNKRLCAKLIKELPFPKQLQARMNNFRRALPNSLAQWK